MGTGKYQRLWMTWLGKEPPQSLFKGLDRWLKESLWRSVGQKDDLLWGEVRTRGSLVYRMALDRHRRLLGCNCASSTQPCVHILALLILWKERIWDDVPETIPPDWIEERLTKPPAPADESRKLVKPWIVPEERLLEMAEGYRFLETWLTDQTQEGWASAMDPPAAHIEEAAARLVTHRLPGPARWLRSLPEPASSREDQSRRLIRILAGLFLACRAFPQSETRKLPIWPHLLQFSGATLRKEQVIASGEEVRDYWLVLSNQYFEEEEGLQRRDNWLIGLRCQRPALLLSFAWKRQPLEAGFKSGTLVEGPLHFYPGLANQRALPGELRPATWPPTASPTGHPTNRDFLDALAVYRTIDPWSPQVPVLVSGSPGQNLSGSVIWQDEQGEALSLHADTEQQTFLLTFQGLQGLALFGLYDAGGISPLSLVHQQEVIPLSLQGR